MNLLLDLFGQKIFTNTYSRLLCIGKNNYEHKKMHNNYNNTINFSLTLLKSKFMKLQITVCIK